MRRRCATQGAQLGLCDELGAGRGGRLLRALAPITFLQGVSTELDTGLDVLVHSSATLEAVCPWKITAFGLFVLITMGICFLSYYINVFTG